MNERETFHQRKVVLHHSGNQSIGWASSMVSQPRPRPQTRKQKQNCLHNIQVFQSVSPLLCIALPLRLTAISAIYCFFRKGHILFPLKVE